MGAAHSKKRRKEKKRRHSISGWGVSGDFDMPRSASVDVIRTLSVSSPASCPRCGCLSNKRTLSTPLECHLDQRRDFLDSTGMEQRCSVPRSYSDALSLQCHHHRHTGPSYYNTAAMMDSYDSCPGVVTTVSHECLRSHNYRGQMTTATMLESSTMSLNRNLAGRQFNIVQSRSSDFRDIDSDPFSSRDRRERSIELTPKRSASFSPSSPSEGRSFEIEGGTQVFNDTYNSSSFPVRSTSYTNTAAPSIVLTAPSPRESRQTSANTNGQSDGGSKLSLLDDEPSRLARWEKRKLMAQQLRMLRKHIQAQEEAKARSNPTSAMPRPPVSLLSCDDENTLSKRFEPSLSSASQPSEHNDTASALDLNSKIERADAIPTTPHRRPPRSKFSKMSNYRYLDNHPVLSKLQNEQNNRLESMERRMRDIKLSAMQEAERRRFAEIFPAKEEKSESERLRLIQEARESLEVLKEEKKRKMSSQELAHPTTASSTAEWNTQKPGTDLPSTSDSGEVIPVRLVPASNQGPGSSINNMDSSNNRGSTSPCTGLNHQTNQINNANKIRKQNSTEKKTDWLNEVWPNINLGQPYTWVLLPFLVFPVLLRMLLSFFITTTTNTNSSSNNSSNTANSKNINNRTSFRDKSSPDLLRRRRFEEVKNGN